MLSINTNLSSLIAQSSLKESTNLLNRAVERMTTGYKINGAKDNAANYSISTNMTTKINAYQIAEDNVAMGLDMVTSMASNLELIEDHTRRIRDLTEQASNGTYGEESLKAIQAEIDARLEEIERIKSSAEYNGVKLLNGEASEGGVTGRFLAPVTQLTEEEAIAEGYTIIRTADDLQAMEDDLDGKYILMNDIDLEGYAWDPVGDSTNYFSGELNGNGCVIQNLTINKPLEDNVGLFAKTRLMIIKNLGMENVNIKGKIRVGALSGEFCQENISNCYVTGNVYGDSNVGGLSGIGELDLLTDVYVEVVVTGNTDVGVYSGCSMAQETVDSYYNSEMSGLLAYGSGDFNTPPTGITTAELNALIIPPTAVAGEKTVTLQVGINGDSNSQISFASSIALQALSIDCSDSITARGCLQTLDDYLNVISAKQTELGAVTNRLESVLQEISIQYDNLVSSRSTLRDADIAKESSTYIQQQILQQASSTLLATANQSPSIALQLI